MAVIYITHSTINEGTPTRIFCNNVSVGAKRSVKVDPNANIDGPVEAQTLAFENQRISLTGVLFDPTQTTLGQDDVLNLLHLKYDGTNAPTLSIQYGFGANKQYVVASDTATTQIPVVLESFNYPISANDSREGYLPTGTLNFIETA